MAVVLRFGGQRLRFGGNNLMWSGHIPHPHTKLIIERALQVGAQLPTKLAEFDLYVRDMYPIWMEYCDLWERFRGNGDVLFKGINLVYPERPLATFNGGLTINNEGVKGNGINGYVDTNFNPSLFVPGQKYQLNDAGRGACVCEEGGSTFASSIIDSAHNSGANVMGGGSAATVNNRINQGTNNTSSPTDSRGLGLKSLNRISDTLVYSINKNNIINTTATSTLLENRNQVLLKVGTNQFSQQGLSSYFMGKAIPYSISQEIRDIENADMARLGLPQIA